jgi:hypothetical protein
MTVHITPDKTVPYPESLEPEVASTLRENMQIASNTAEVLKGLGAEVDDDPEAQDKAGERIQSLRRTGEATVRRPDTRQTRGNPAGPAKKPPPPRQHCMNCQ